MKPVPVESLRKGLRILELLCDAGREGLALAEIAGRMNLKANTCHNLLKTLCVCGYAANPEQGRYVYGEKIGALLRLAAAEPPPSLVEAIGRLAAELNETIVLTTLAGGCRRVLLRAHGNRTIQVNCRTMEDAAGHLWQTPTGRVLAAYCGPRELDELLEREGFPGDRWAGIVDPDALTDALAAIRRQGLAEQHVRDVAALAVPVRAPSGLLLGAVGMYMPEYRWNEEVRERSVRLLRAAAPGLAERWHANERTDSGD
jgi:DNA-binding IclR family transcriptional regulator